MKVAVMSSEIAIHEFVERLEKFSLDIYKQCLMSTNQFSAKFILQKVIKDHAVHTEQVFQITGELSEDKVDSIILNGIKEDFTKKNIETDFDLQILNFVEANNLAVKLMEYVIEKYDQVLKYDMSSASKEKLNLILEKKNQRIEYLKSEYEKVRYK